MSQLHNLGLGWWRNSVVQKSCETVCRAEPHEIRKVKLKRLDCWDRGLKEAKHEHENQKILKRVGLWQVSHTATPWSWLSKANPLPPERPLPGLQRTYHEDSTAETTSGSLTLALLSVELINNILINNCCVLLINIYLAYNVCLCNAQGAQTKAALLKARMVYKRDLSGQNSCMPHTPSFLLVSAAFSSAFQGAAVSRTEHRTMCCYHQLSAVLDSVWLWLYFAWALPSS